MVWFYERHGQYLRYEVRQECADPGYELCVSYPDERTQVEHFEDPRTLIERFKETHGRLRDDGWSVTGLLDLRMA